MQRQSLHMQRLYKRRKTDEGKIKSNWSVFGENTVINGATPAEEDETIYRHIILDGGVVQ